MFTSPPTQSNPIGPAGKSGDLTDAELLEAFLQGRDAEPFETLVLRHAPMVFGVCRRILGNRHDAEDAFQAAFLVLVRKARSIRPQHHLVNWLYGVACRTSLQAKAVRERNARRERSMNPLPEQSQETLDSNDWLGLLDEELSQLPETYRAPLILCELEGLCYRDAGAQLGLSEKAISLRLVRGRKMLAARLARHATVPTAGMFALSFSSETASAAVPASLVASTVHAAPFWAAGSAAAGSAAGGVVSARVAALAQSVIKRMFLSKLMIGAIVLSVGLFGIVAGTAIAWGPRSLPSQSGNAEGNAVTKQVARRIDSFDGTWTAVSAEAAGKSVPDDEVRAAPIRLVVQGTNGTISNVVRGGEPRGTLQFDMRSNPALVALAFRQTDGSVNSALGICLREGDRLRICYGTERPAEFRTRPDRNDQRLFVFEREEPRGP